MAKQTRGFFGILQSIIGTNESRNVSEKSSYEKVRR